MSNIEVPLAELLSSSPNDHLSILRHIRAHKVHDPPLALFHGNALLGNSDFNSDGKSSGKSTSTSTSTFRKLPDMERLSILELICTAALHTRNLEIAKAILTTIRTEISNKDSVRYRKLLALCLEADGDLTSAGRIYADMLEENPCNSYVMKRQYCLMRDYNFVYNGNNDDNDDAAAGSGGNDSVLQQTEEKEEKAQIALNDYLEHNGSDTSAWLEMANRCLSSGDFKGAAFCYEEIVLSCPMDSTVHCMLGELYVTIGGKENLSLGRKHLAMSLELDGFGAETGTADLAEGKGLRALYGLVSATEAYLELVEAATADESSSSKKNKKMEFTEEDIDMARDLYKYGVGKLNRAYKGTFMNALLDKVLE